MNSYIKEFRDSSSIKNMIELINSKNIPTINIMEVCGGHTHSIMKYSLDKLLHHNINFIHGPGCPVCIMPKGRVDHAIALAKERDNILVTLGDMIKVLGSKETLQLARANGADVRVVYSALDALNIAKENSNKNVIFFAIGFETTTPMSAILVQKAIEQNIKNLFLHINHVIVPPAIRHILTLKEAKIDALIAPGHTSAITGMKVFTPIVETYNIPTVISGFEPTDILYALHKIVNQIETNSIKLENAYNRVVTYDGNILAQEKINKYFKLRDSFEFRGLGVLKNSALKLRDEFSMYDAEVVFSSILPTAKVSDDKDCQCPNIISGIKKPTECKLFGKKCTPTTPVGSCMVSNEGACSAYYRYNIA